MSYTRNGIGETDTNFDRKALKLQEGVPLWTIYDPRRGGPHDPLRYLLSGTQRRSFGNFGAAKESDDKKRREFHVRAEELHSNRNTMHPQVLFRQSVALKNEIAPYVPWDGCGRFWCPLNTYLSKHEITQRIRETDVTARNRMSNTERAVEDMGYITQETRDARTKGVEAGIIASEKSRGKSTTELTAENLPEQVKIRAKEMYDSATQYVDFLGKYKTPILVLGAVGVAGWIFRPYIMGLNRAV